MDVCVLFSQVLTYIQVVATVNPFYYLCCGRISSVSRALDCRAVGREPGARTILKVLKQLRNEGTLFALQTARPSRGLDDHIKWPSCLHKGKQK